MTSKQVIRDLELLPQLLGQDWSSVFLQRYASGEIWVTFHSIFTIPIDLKVLLRELHFISHGICGRMIHKFTPVSGQRLVSGTG